MKTKHLFITALLAATSLAANAQNAKPEDTEFYTPVPPVVSPGKAASDAPSDAIVLFGGKNLDEWVLVNDTAATDKWLVAKNVITVDKKKGDIQTKRKFTDFQLHIEYRIPADIEGSGQARGNSGIFLAALPWGAGGYELQVLDNYNNKTYTNGQAGSMYKQSPPLANACRKPGDWNTYDVVWTAPRFNEDGTVKTPARVTAIHNGVLVQNNYELKGDTPYIGAPKYRAHGPAPIKLQSHGDPSKPISYRNIWVRNL
ncbi:3-keto-disaccharide hydrolase [Mucilaginibacter pedocola]|uniref:3-keto-alpha-glucoside-1,2-lyase/3-keto-2-hydroxy-glucal hydratase domain-containing protein n=1 Tax=Mucilaginibacter pedocola TaxID=1792845 RepID=A0A1S9P7X6_9SPHI|nr:DUF1080 domain-containing protein [Mucilaginibacter pedocola]OOQ57055.1 hypothetical protein BC343_16105 [Mucilaginibacter pedocola]